MKGPQQLLVALVLSTASPALAAKDTPVSQVVTLIVQLKAKIEADGLAEQKSYDKFECWCEKTLERKAKEIEDAKARIIELQELIYKLNGDLGVYGADVEQLKKDIAANIQAQKEATEMREKEYAEYEADRTEAEQCSGALEAAIKVLTPAGKAKKGLLQTIQEAQVISVAAGLKDFLNRPEVSQTVKESDLAAVRRFVESPQEFIRPKSGALMQTGNKRLGAKRNNPFGDYAPQSTQIQGILKGMYDAFTTGLEKDNAEEADKQKAFEELMKTKKEELLTLKVALAKMTGDDAAAEKLVADSEAEQDALKEQLKVDEAFFAETKASCKLKATEWSTRSRLRTEELNGIIKALAILNSPEAQRTFTAARTTLLQLSQGGVGVYERLRVLATKYNSIGLAQIAAAAKAGSGEKPGSFDKVIAMITDMIALLRKEAMDDIAHRDRCQNSQFDNKNDQEDYGHDISKAEQSLEIMADEAKKLEREIEMLEEEIEGTKKDMADRLAMRNEESAAFVQALKEDTNAIAILSKAIEALEAYYHRNKIPLELVQGKQPAEQYTVDEDKAPQVIWEGADYRGAKSESEGIIAILGMLREDFENEIKTGREEDAAAQKQYLADRAALEETLAAQEETKLTLNKKLAELKMKIGDTQEFKAQRESDLDAANKMEKALEHDCAWVETHFESRKANREKEIAGLQEAKTILAGAESEEKGEEDSDDLEMK